MAELESQGMLLHGAPVVDEELLRDLRREHPGYDDFLEHERLRLLTFPFEWTVSMLADAAVVTLDLQLRLLQNDLTLKDASAYNVQFRGSRPVFIDHGSIERLNDWRVWYALGQFQRMFTFPLLLVRHRGWDLKSYFLGAPDGRSEQEVARAWGKVARLRPALLLDVTLPAMLAPRSTDATLAAKTGRRSGGSGDAQRANLLRLRRKIRALGSGYRTSSPWTEYEASRPYSEAAELAKLAIVESFLSRTRPRQVLDIGCNTGAFSFMAARHGAEVVAIDSDHDSVELLYRRLQVEPANVTPLVINIAAPSPAIGLLYEERSRFHDRIRPDCVLALAILHHLLITSGIPLLQICELLHASTTDHLVLEFVPSDDPLFRRLTRLHKGVLEPPDLDRVRAALAQRFHVEREEPVPGSGRVLLFMRKR